MLEITPLAQKKLKAFKEAENTDLPIRIAIMSGASGSPNLGVLPDEATEKDQVQDLDGVQVIIDKELLEYCEEITVDYVKMESSSCSLDGGFKISQKNHL